MAERDTLVPVGSPLTPCSAGIPSCVVVASLVALFALASAVPLAAPDLSGYPWLYLRADHPLVADEETVEIIVVGDVMLGRGLARDNQPFAAVTRWLAAADLTVGNLECVISSEWSGRAVAENAGPEPLRASPSAVGQIRQAGFDVLGLANNHAGDLGSEGLAETSSRLQSAGMTTMGAGASHDAALKAVIRDVRGLRLAFLAFNAIPGGDPVARDGWTWAHWEPEQISAAVSAASEGADAVVVFVHWGYEYDTRVDPAQRQAAELVLKAGADLIVGQHPHVVQSFEVVDGKFVAYSLGNFVFDQWQGHTAWGMVLRAFFDDEGLRAVQALPVKAGARPSLMTPREGRLTARRLDSGLSRLVFVCNQTICQRVESAGDNGEHERSGLFWGGRTDLTGDGIPEHVRRIRERVIVYEGDREVWRSPEEWRVVDLALGDPNDDGRSELMLALWKPGLDGLESPSGWQEATPRSRPFIVGYRGGLYRTLWGGSAVTYPIHEVELGDVDGDRVEELVVVEALGDGSPKRTVSVWQWHGWGFSNVWRSQPGRYSDLRLGPDGAVHIAIERAEECCLEAVRGSNQASGLRDESWPAASSAWKGLVVHD